MTKDTTRQITNLVAIVVLIGMNILANALPLNNQNTGQISDRFESLFTPAGYVFSIWGVIYLGLIAFAIFQMLPSQRENPRLRKLGTIFAWSCLANIVWLFFWHYNQFLLTEVAMLALLVLLAATYILLKIGRANVSRAEVWLVQVPMSIYLGWISVATIANTAILLLERNWNGWGVSPPVWTVIVMLVGFLLGVLMVLIRHDAPFVLVLVWAYVGIGVPSGADQALVTALAYVLATLLAIGAAVTPLIKRIA